MIYERAITLLSGRYGGRAAPQAYLEFAQEHFLAWMAALLAVIGSTYGAMGEPTGAVEIRLGQASKGDLFWAQQIYESRRATLRV